MCGRTNKGEKGMCVCVGRYVGQKEGRRECMARRYKRKRKGKCVCVRGNRSRHDRKKERKRGVVGQAHQKIKEKKKGKKKEKRGKDNMISNTYKRKERKR